MGIQPVMGQGKISERLERNKACSKKHCKA